VGAIGRRRIGSHDAGGRLGIPFTIVGMGDRHIRSGSPYEPTYGFSRAVRVGDRVIVAALLDPAWRVEAEAEAMIRS
jgi:hypothetical protein